MGSWGICEQEGWRKGPWTPAEDKLLIEYISQNGEGRWSFVSKCTGLKRSGKSCRLRWVNYLRPGLKKGHLTPQEEGIIIELHALWGNKWSTIARYLPGRTDNEIKNYWRTHFKKKSKPDQIKQEKKKEIIIKQQQQQQTDDNKNIINKIPLATQLLTSIEEKNNKQEAEIVFSGIDENHHQFLPMVYQDTSSWSDNFIPLDCYLWGGLWDLGDDDPNGCSKMGAQNQDNYYSCEGEYAVDYIF
ncbi:hypothetical protein DH2020_037626 [Rehmannia glutinosa]|uniref:R2R3-MYB protein n=1 Tax=Rehmannia glutinosa TaxID=99300 RepID=A0ABR0V3L6_REHGL